jgi:hypothetical protein
MLDMTKNAIHGTWANAHREVAHAIKKISQIENENFKKKLRWVAKEPSD